MCDGRGGFHILWIWFSNCTAFYVGCKPHIVLILSGVIWCRYVALYAYGVFSFTYVMNFIVIIDLTRCCFLQYGALALFGWAGVAGTVTVCSRHCWGFYAEYFRVVDWPTLCPFLMRRYSIFFPSCCNVFSSDLCPHHFSTQTDAPGGVTIFGLNACEVWDVQNTRISLLPRAAQLLSRPFLQPRTAAPVRPQISEEAHEPLPSESDRVAVCEMSKSERAGSAVCFQAA